MPLIDVPVIDDRDLSRGTLAGGAWGPLITADFRRVGEARVVIASEVYHSLGAYADGASRPDKQDLEVVGEELRQEMRDHPDVFISLFAMIDRIMQRRLGGTIVPADLAVWTAEPPDPDPAPES